MEKLWAPWRLEYIESGGTKSAEKKSCFFCAAFADVGNERDHLLIERGKSAFVMLNRFPYNVGHLMVAPARHIGNFEQVKEDEAAEIWALVGKMKLAMQKAFNPGGFNIGINQGKCAGAGVIDHLHVHIVPRWEGDTNFMPVMSDCRVMSQHLESCREKLLSALN